MKTFISDALQIFAALLLSGGVLVSATPPPQVSTPVQASITSKVTAKETAPITVKEETVVEPTTEPTTTASAPIAVVQDVTANENIAWSFLMSQGFTRNQTAGIMGNLQQEHGFKTSDVPGGLGIAQWTASRRDNLMARENYLDINVQLQFLVEEMGGIASTIKAYDGVENSVIVFQNQFERCGVCMESQRISYAYAILNRH